MYQYEKGSLSYVPIFILVYWTSFASHGMAVFARLTKPVLVGVGLLPSLWSEGQLLGVIIHFRQERVPGWQQAKKLWEILQLVPELELRPKLYVVSMTFNCG